MEINTSSLHPWTQSNFIEGFSLSLSLSLSVYMYQVNEGHCIILLENEFVHVQEKRQAFVCTLGLLLQCYLSAVWRRR